MTFCGSWTWTLFTIMQNGKKIKCCLIWSRIYQPNLLIFEIYKSYYDSWLDRWSVSSSSDVPNKMFHDCVIFKRPVYFVLDKVWLCFVAEVGSSIFISDGNLGINVKPVISIVPLFVILRLYNFSILKLNVH